MKEDVEMHFRKLVKNWWEGGSGTGEGLKCTWRFLVGVGGCFGSGTSRRDTCKRVSDLPAQVSQWKQRLIHPIFPSNNHLDCTALNDCFED